MDADRWLILSCFVIISVALHKIVARWTRKHKRTIASTVKDCPLVILNNPQKDLSIIIPAFNEKSRLPNTLIALLNALYKRKDINVEIIIVDDGSRDETSVVGRVTVKEFLIQHPMNCALISIKLNRNYGKGMAGTLESTGKVILYMDSDGATDVEEVLRVYNIMENLTMTMVCGVRNPETCQRSKVRQLTSNCFAKVAKILGNSMIPDSQCGFKAFTRDAARLVFTRNHLIGWAFDVELLLLAQKLNVQTPGISVQWTEKSGSKLSIRKDSLAMLIDMLLMRIMYETGVWKIK